MRTKLFLDMDGVIINTIKCITDLYNEDFCYYSSFKYIDWCEINSWDFTECTLADREYINRYFNQPRFFKQVEFMDNAKEIIPLISANYDIYVVSHGFSPNLRLKRIWIEQHMPYVKDFIGVNLKEHDDKSCVDMSDGIFIDDGAINLETSSAGVKICFGDEYPWNKNWTSRRCNNWYDVGRFLGVIK